MIKLLLGGSPCTNWSIAKKAGRETEPSGVGWELFENYLIAKDKFKPDIFLYENVASASRRIKEKISDTLGVDLLQLNSALVSAQNRNRIYGVNAKVEPPEDRHIYLRDILESGQDLLSREKAYCLLASYGRAVLWNTIERGQRTMVAEPVCVAQRGRYIASGNRTVKTAGGTEQYYEARTDGKTNALTTVEKDDLVAQPVEFCECNYDLIPGAQIYVACGKIRQEKHGIYRH